MNMIKNKKMNCKNCHEPIHPDRLIALPHTTTCINCSDVQGVACVDIVYHKTGNTIQIMDKDSAKAINKASQRTGFGSLKALKGGSGGDGLRNVTTGVYKMRIPPNFNEYEKVGEEVMKFVEFKEKEEAIELLNNALSKHRVTPTQHTQLMTIVNELC
jgi:hypothetical protein